MTDVLPLRQRSAWAALEAHHGAIAGRHLRERRRPGPRGAAARRPSACTSTSKNRVTDETMRLLLQLAEESDLAGHQGAMFRGEHINVSEDRAVLHVALRMPRATLVVDGVDVVAQVNEVLDRMSAFADRVRSGDWKGTRASRSAMSSTSASGAATSAGDGLRGAPPTAGAT